MARVRKTTIAVAVLNELHGFHFDKQLGVFLRLRATSFREGEVSFRASLDVLPPAVSLLKCQIDVPGEVVRWWESNVQPAILRTIVREPRNMIDLATLGTYVIDGQGKVAKRIDPRESRQ